jgi:hypothetical protein
MDKTCKCFVLGLVVAKRMQNPNEDTEWNDILRAKGILPPKQEEPTISEDTVVQVSLVQYIAYVWAMELSAKHSGRLLL